jgi:hypothetical protein
MRIVLEVIIIEEGVSCFLGGATSSYATAGIARVSGALKPHHRDKVVIA